MTDQETLSFFTEIVNYYEKDYPFPNPNNKQVKAYKVAIEAFENIQKIRAITERALRSQDPINLYKACCINEIAKILGIEEVKQDIKEQDDKDQITIDDIIKEV